MPTLKTEAEIKKLRADGTKESVIERHFMKVAKLYGCKQRKLTQHYAEDGWPDRLIVWPGGVTDYVELKRPVGGKLEPRQKTVIADLIALRCNVVTLHTKEVVDMYFADRAKALGVKVPTPTKRKAKLMSVDELQTLTRLQRLQ